MHCIIAFCDNKAPFIVQGLKTLVDFGFDKWHFDCCVSTDELISMMDKRPDVVVVDRYLPGESHSYLLKHLQAMFPASRIVLYVGNVDEETRAYVRMAQNFGLNNIVSGELPGERPYNLPAALLADRYAVESDSAARDLAGENNLDDSVCNNMTGTGPDISGMKTEMQQRNRHEDDIEPGYRDISTENYQQPVSEPTNYRSYQRRPSHRPRGKVVIVTANKGGVGKTTDAIALAISMARSGIRTALADLDLAGPNIATFFDIKNCTGIEVISRRGDYHRVVAEITIEIEKNLFVLPGVMDKTMPSIGPEQILNAVETLAEEFDVVICDTPPGFWEKEWLFDLYPRADIVLSVVDQSKFSECETRDYAPKLIMMGVDPSCIKIVCNKFNPKLHNVKKVEAFFNSGLNKKIKPLPRVVVAIPENWEAFVKDGYGSGIPGINDTLSPWRRLTDEVAREFNLTLQYNERPKEKKGFFAGLLRRGTDGKGKPGRKN